jgi:hypothetical protein
VLIAWIFCQHKRRRSKEEEGGANAWRSLTRQNRRGRVRRMGPNMQKTSGSESASTVLAIILLLMIWSAGGARGNSPAEKQLAERKRDTGKKVAMREWWRTRTRTRRGGIWEWQRTKDTSTLTASSRLLLSRPMSQLTGEYSKLEDRYYTKRRRRYQARSRIEAVRRVRGGKESKDRR